MSPDGVQSLIPGALSPEELEHLVRVAVQDLAMVAREVSELKRVVAAMRADMDRLRTP